MAETDAPDPRPKRSRTARRLGLLLTSIVVGIIGGGYFLDESPPELDDLAVVPPTVADPDPFTWLTADTPLPPGTLAGIAARLRLPLTASAPAATEEQLVTWLDDRELIDALEAVRNWSAEFEAAFSHSGGDPREGFITKRTVYGFTTDGGGPIGLGRTERIAFPFHEVLGHASALERATGDIDQAVASLTRALQFESWQVMHVPEAVGFGRLEELLERVRAIIESGDLWETRNARTTVGLRGWTAPTELLAARVRAHFATRRDELLAIEYWNTLDGSIGAKFRVKEQRAVRRLADRVRALLADPLNPDVVGLGDSNPLVRAWLDPYGDTALGLEFDYLHNMQHEYLDLRRTSEMLRLALAILLHERARGSAPELLTDLVPASLDELPTFPRAAGLVAWNVRDRVLTLPISEKEVLEVRIPAPTP